MPLNSTLVTTCLNESGSVEKWRQDVLAQTRGPDEVIIVDSESTDGTRDVLLRWAAQDSRVKVVVRKCTVSQGRNLAFELASHEYVASTDMGCRIDRNWLRELLRPFEEHPETEAVMGAYRSDPQSVNSPAARAEFYLVGDGFPFVKDKDDEWQLCKGIVPGNRSVAYTKSLWEELGRFPEDLTRCADDSVFGRQVLQSECHFAIAPDAIVYWTRFSRLRDFWKEQYGYGLGDGEADIKKPAAFRWHERGWIPRWFVPTLTAIRRLQKDLRLSAAIRGIRSRDPVGLLYLPALSYGNGYHFGLGYSRGHSRRNEHCRHVRLRLNRGD